MLRSLLIPLLPGDRGSRPLYDPGTRLVSFAIGGTRPTNRALPWTASPVFRTRLGGLAVRVTTLDGVAADRPGAPGIFEQVSMAAPEGESLAWIPSARSFAPLRDAAPGSAEFAIAPRAAWNVLACPFDEVTGLVAPAAPDEHPVLRVLLAGMRTDTGRQARTLRGAILEHAAPEATIARLASSWFARYAALDDGVSTEFDAKRLHEGATLVDVATSRVDRAPNRSVNSPTDPVLVCHADMRFAIADPALRFAMWRLAALARFSGTGGATAKGHGLTWTEPSGIGAPLAPLANPELEVLQRVWAWHGSPADLEPVAVERAPGGFRIGRASRRRRSGRSVSCVD